MGSIIMQLVQIIAPNLRSQLTNTPQWKWLKAKNHTLPRKVLKGRIYFGGSIKLLVGEAIPHSNPSSKINSRTTVISAYIALTGQSL